MLQAKTFELRDRNTFIPIVAINCRTAEGHKIERTIADEYLLRRAGYGPEFDCILLTRLDGGVAHYDPPIWNDRTFKVAHRYIQKHWNELQSGAVIDVEYILRETEAPKLSEWEDDHDNIW